MCRLPAAGVTPLELGQQPSSCSWAPASWFHLPPLLGADQSPIASPPQKMREFAHVPHGFTKSFTNTR